mmetsp:Transcript_2575/g.3502  ORF Transcript_2575/g.3502 Transcript_2575/m.3502 type:complete len:326 (+) Transcript_2575:54-1031(+)
MMKQEEVRPSKVRVWLLATRPNTLALSLTPVLIGSALLAKEIERFSMVPSLLFWVFAALIQIGTNLHNDYSDFIKGADTEERLGQARATQRGWLTANETLGGALFVLSLASAIGLHLALHQSGCMYFMTFVLITSVFNAMAYTGGYPLSLIGLGHFSLGYFGLGDIFVLIYFGFVATIAPYYLQKPFIFPPLLLTAAAASLGCLATGVMCVNNLRDRETDVKANKRTLAVRFGQRFARFEYCFLIVLAYLIPTALVFLRFAPMSWLLVYLSAPIARSRLHSIITTDGAALNPHVGGTAKLQLIFGLLLFTAILLSSFSTPALLLR